MRRNEFLQEATAEPAEKKQAPETAALARTLRVRYIDLLNAYGHDAPGQFGFRALKVNDSVKIYNIPTKYEITADVAEGGVVPLNAIKVSVKLDGMKEVFKFNAHNLDSDDITVSASKDLLDEKGKIIQEDVQAGFDDVYNYGGLLNIIDSQLPKMPVRKPPKLEVLK